KVDGQDPSFSIAQNAPKQTKIDFDEHTVEELSPLPAGYQFAGWKVFAGNDVSCDTTAAPLTSGSAPDQSADVPEGEGAVTVCFYNDKFGKLIIHKVNIGGNQDDAFSGTFTGPTNGAFNDLQASDADGQTFNALPGSYA